MKKTDYRERGEGVSSPGPDEALARGGGGGVGPESVGGGRQPRPVLRGEARGPRPNPRHPPGTLGTPPPDMGMATPTRGRDRVGYQSVGLAMAHRGFVYAKASCLLGGGGGWRRRRHRNHDGRKVVRENAEGEARESWPNLEGMIARNGFGNVFQRKPPTKFKLVLIYRQTDAFISSNSSGSVLSEKGGKTATKKCEKSSDIFTDNENKFSGGNLILTKAEMLGLWYVDFFCN